MNNICSVLLSTLHRFNYFSTNYSVLFILINYELSMCSYYSLPCFESMLYFISMVRYQTSVSAKNHESYSEYHSITMPTLVVITLIKALLIFPTELSGGRKTQRQTRESNLGYSACKVIRTNPGC